MFRNASRSKDTLLPHSGNGRGGGGGLYGSARMSPKAAISKSFIATMVWLSASLALIYGGWAYCSRRMESTSVKCDRMSCQVLELKSGVTEVLTIPRWHMVRGEVVRLKNGKVVNPADLRRSAQRKLGHTYSLVYVEPDSEDDDDESYDSFEDDDDSYDSYDGDDDSSEDEDEDEVAVLPPGSRGSRASIPPAGGPGGAKAAMPDASTMQARRAAQEKRKAEQQAKYAEERRARGLPPIVEPDKQKEEKLKASVMTGRGGRTPDSDEDEDRFPGDAGTMLDANRQKNREQIRRLEAEQGMAAEAYREQSKRSYEEASRAHQARQKIDSQMRQRGNNLHDRTAETANKRKLSPDDPDSKLPTDTNAGPPKLERQEAQKDLNAGGNGQAEDKTEEIKMGKGGGRATSSLGGLEEQDEGTVGPEANEGGRRRLSSQKGDQGEANAVIGDNDNDNDNDFESLGDFVQAGATGARRKLLDWKKKAKNIKPAPAKRSKVEVARDAEKERDIHRKGRGHHHKRARKVAQPTEPEESSVAQKKKGKHHHKAFHHKEDVPQEDRHHVHHAFHHQEGQKKIEHGWRHQNRQWHGREELKKVGTTYGLGRTTAKRRKEAIDSYVSKRTSEVNFTDSKKWRAGGLWMMIVGSISIAFCLVIGNFRPRPKTKKVS